MVRSFLRSVDDFLDCLEHVLTATAVHIETGDEEAPPGFQVLFVLPTGVSTDDVVPPSGWVLERDDNDSATRLRLYPSDPFVLDGSVSPLRERLDAIRDVPDQVTVEVPSPAGERPADPVEEFYTIRSHPELETDEDVELFVRLLAHSKGLLAKADNLRWEKGTVVSLDTTVVEERLDEPTVKTWVEDRHDMQRILNPKTVADSTADSETALVEADAVLERDGKQQTEQREYLVATEDGDWKLLG